MEKGKFSFIFKGSLCMFTLAHKYTHTYTDENHSKSSKLEPNRARDANFRS